MSKVYYIKDDQLWHGYTKSFNRSQATARRNGTLRYFNKDLEPLIINKIHSEKKISDKSTIQILTIKQEADFIWYTYRIGTGSVLTGGSKPSYLMQFK
jgi:hypothetical protein